MKRVVRREAKYTGRNGIEEGSQGRAEPVEASGGIEKNLVCGACVDKTRVDERSLRGAH